MYIPSAMRARARRFFESRSGNYIPFFILMSRMERRSHFFFTIFWEGAPHFSVVIVWNVREGSLHAWDAYWRQARFLYHSALHNNLLMGGSNWMLFHTHCWSFVFHIHGDPGLQREWILRVYVLAATRLSFVFLLDYYCARSRCVICSLVPQTRDLIHSVFVIIWRIVMQPR